MFLSETCTHHCTALQVHVSCAHCDKNDVEWVVVKQYKRAAEGRQ